MKKDYFGKKKEPKQNEDSAQRIRQISNIMERDNFRCRLCEESENLLSVHDMYFGRRKKFWEYEEWELITLCRSCCTSEYTRRYNAMDDAYLLGKAGIDATYAMQGLYNINLAKRLGLEDKIQSVIERVTGKREEEFETMDNLFLNIK
ncbi:MAG: hypothetical protein LBE91_08285 [Tannerella sp.]|jgi:hypothetical protein|nr:hypothetical protein [Tannerella sp.]